MILPVDLALERCLVTNLPTSLTPRALQAHTTESLSENLKTQGGASAAGGAPTLKSVTRTPKKLRENMLCRTVLKAHNLSK